MTTEDHIHEEGEYHRALDLWFCRCGYEKRKDGEWRPPKTMEGLIRRASAWKAEQ